MVAVAPVPNLRGAQVPRIRVVPEGVDHPRWSEVEDFVRNLNVELDPWQWDILRVSLMRVPDMSMWAAFTVAVCCPRQNGKNALLEIRELVGPVILGEPLVIHSAHLADTSKEGFRRLDQLLEMNDWLSRDVKHIWRTNGHEAIEFNNGCRIRFRTRTKGGGRGFAKGSPIMFDEAMIFPETSLGSILPIASAHPDPQLWYTGSAVDQAIHEDGVVFARVRDRALSGDHKRLAYFEWSLDYATPDEVDESVLTDMEAAAATNPAFGIRITPDYIEAEARELADRTLAVERFGVGDWPPVDGSGDHVFPIDVWDSLADDPAAAGARMGDPVAFAFDVSPSRESASIVAVGRRTDGLAQMEVTDMRPGTEWLPARLFELQSKHSPVAIVCASSSPAAAVLFAVQNAGVWVTEASEAEHAMACGVIYDRVTEKAIRHLGGKELRNAVKGATKRPLGDSWAWSRRNSSVDITPLVAATLALWGYETCGGGGISY